MNFCNVLQLIKRFFFSLHKGALTPSFQELQERTLLPDCQMGQPLD